MSTTVFGSHYLYLFNEHPSFRGVIGVTCFEDREEDYVEDVGARWYILILKFFKILRIWIIRSTLLSFQELFAIQIDSENFLLVFVEIQQFVL